MGWGTAGAQQGAADTLWDSWQPGFCLGNAGCAPVTVTAAAKCLPEELRHLQTAPRSLSLKCTLPYLLSSATVKSVFMCLVNVAGVKGGLRFVLFLMCSLYVCDQTINRNHIFRFFSVPKAQQTA